MGRKAGIRQRDEHWMAAMAGLKTWTSDIDHSCSRGPFVRRANGRMQMITAGHCFGLNGGKDVPWKHGPSGNAIGIAGSSANHLV